MERAPQASNAFPNKMIESNDKCMAQETKPNKPLATAIRCLPGAMYFFTS